MYVCIFVLIRLLIGNDQLPDILNNSYNNNNNNNIWLCCVNFLNFRQAIFNIEGNTLKEVVLSLR